MISESPCMSFEPSGVLALCNAFEPAICKTVFQDKYSSSVKTYHVVKHLKARGEELDLMDNASYRTAIKELQKFSRYHAGLIKGFAGERKAFYAVKHALNAGIQLTNVELSYEGERNEYDQILLTRHGLIIIEVKNYSCDSIIEPNGILKTQDDPFITYNIGERMGSKSYVLRQIASQAIGRSLLDNEIRCIVVNANDTTRMSNKFDLLETLCLGNLERRIRELMNDDTCLSSEEVSAVHSAINTLGHPSQAAPSIDFDYVATTLHRAISLIEQAAKKREAETESFFESHEVEHDVSKTNGQSQHNNTVAISITALLSLALGAASGYAFAKLV